MAYMMWKVLFEVSGFDSSLFYIAEGSIDQKMILPMGPFNFHGNDAFDDALDTESTEKIKTLGPFFKISFI